MESQLTARQRLVAFYEHYNPSKLGTVDEILVAYHDAEDELFADLIQRYGPEPMPDGDRDKENEYAHGMENYRRPDDGGMLLNHHVSTRGRHVADAENALERRWKSSGVVADPDGTWQQRASRSLAAGSSNPFTLPPNGASAEVITSPSFRKSGALIQLGGAGTASDGSPIRTITDYRKAQSGVIAQSLMGAATETAAEELAFHGSIVADDVAAYQRGLAERARRRQGLPPKEITSLLGGQSPRNVRPLDVWREQLAAKAAAQQSYLSRGSNQSIQAPGFAVEMYGSKPGYRSPKSSLAPPANIVRTTIEHSPYRGVRQFVKDSNEFSKDSPSQNGSYREHSPNQKADGLFFRSSRTSQQTIPTPYGQPAIFPADIRAHHQQQSRLGWNLEDDGNEVDPRAAVSATQWGSPAPKTPIRSSVAAHAAVTNAVWTRDSKSSTPLPQADWDSSQSPHQTHVHQFEEPHPQLTRAAESKGIIKQQDIAALVTLANNKGDAPVVCYECGAFGVLRRGTGPTDILNHGKYGNLAVSQVSHVTGSTPTKPGGIPANSYRTMVERQLAQMQQPQLWPGSVSRFQPGAHHPGVESSNESHTLKSDHQIASEKKQPEVPPAEPEPVIREPTPVERRSPGLLDRLSGMQIPDEFKITGKAYNDKWDLLQNSEAVEMLHSGDLLFSFACKVGATLKDTDRAQIDAVINISAFNDEVAENNVPFIDAYDAEAMKKYTCILVKTMYILPGLDPTQITPEILADQQYQKACQPGNPKLHDVSPGTEPNTFRFTKSMISYIYSMTVQLRASEIVKREDLQRLRTVDGIIPTKALIMERTKRDRTKIDDTAKCKSALLYYRIDGGMLVTNLTVVLNTFIPGPIASLLNSFHGKGLGEAVETGMRTRKYLRSSFGDSRSRAGIVAPAPVEVEPKVAGPDEDEQ